MRLIPPVRLAILTAALTFTACDPGTTDGDSDNAKLSFAIPMAFSGSTIAAQRVDNGTEIDRMDVQIVVKSTGEVVLRKTLTEGSSEVEEGGDEEGAKVTLNFRVPTGGEAETFTLTIDGLIGGTRIYQIGPIDFQLGADGRTANVTVQAQYVGPGNNVTGVSISPRSITVAVNQTATFSCTGTPGNVVDFPYELETTNPQVASVQTVTTLRGGMVGTTELVCRLGFGSRFEDRIPVTVTGGSTITLVSGGGQTGAINTTLPTPIVVHVRNGDGSNAGGVTVTFTPNASIGMANPASVVTNSAGQATTSWTLGPATGTQTLKASATVGGVPVSIDITASATNATGQTGSIAGTVLSNQGTPIQGATVELRSGSNNVTGSPVATTTSNTSGSFTFALLPAGVYTVRATASSFSDATANVTVTAGASNSATVTLTALGTGAIAGTATNAQTGAALAGATVEVRSGTGVTTGTPLATTTSAANGGFSFQNRIAGAYTVLAKATGFADAVANVTVVANQTANVPLSLSPTLAAGQLRIVVTWGNALDLDSHTSVPQGANGTGAPIVVFWNSPYTNQQGCSLATNPFACLEHDAVPPVDPPTESTRIGTVLPGTYSFRVHNFTADAEDRAASDNSLATSGARVDVYVGGSSVAQSSFNVPNQPGNMWTVFSLSTNGSTITVTPVNTMSVVNLAEPPSGGPGAALRSFTRAEKTLWDR